MNFASSPFLNQLPATSAIDNDPVGARDVVALLRNNMSLEPMDYALGQTLNGAAGLNVGDMWYPAGTMSAIDTLGTVATAAGTLVAVPFLTGNQPVNQLFLNGLGCNVTTLGSGSNVRIGVYTSLAGTTTTMYPGALVADSGDLDSTATGFKSATLSPAVALTPNTLYWVAINTKATAPTLSQLTAKQLIPIFGWSAANPPVPRLGWTVAFAYAAMPASYPASATLATTAPGAAFLRFA